MLLELVDAGLTRDEAYRLVQRNAMKTWDGSGTLQENLAADSDITLDEGTLSACFTAERALHNTGIVFDRLEATAPS